MKNFTFLTIWLVFCIAMSIAALSNTENAIKHVHDPCIIKQGEYYYVFSTGPGVMIRRSKDLVNWEFVGRVFEEDVPKWAKEDILGCKSLWAPDIAYFNRKYYLYYSVSTFGKNRSLIGLATNKTLDKNSKDYVWKDEGKVFESFPENNYNAIDSHILRISKDRMVMSFGSFWSGVKMVEADPKTGKAIPNSEVISLSRRPSPCAVEAPFIIMRGGYFYLFVSFDLCCRGIKSTYNIRVGRSKTIEGPYLDYEGKSLLEDGGTIVSQTEGDIIGTGHCSILKNKNQYLLVNHYYDAKDNGVPTLQIRSLKWDKNGWLTVEPLQKP